MANGTHPKGCQIGAGTVVGGFSSVTTSLPPDVLAVGTPAKVVRTGIAWQRERVAGTPPA